MNESTTTTYDHESFLESLNGESLGVFNTSDGEIRDLGNDTVAKIEYALDEDADLSFYGKYTDRFDGWAIDRRDGVLYGDYQTHTYRYITRSEDRALERATKRAMRDGFQLSEDSDYTAELYPEKDGPNAYTVTVTGYKMEAVDLLTRNDSRSFQYFKPEPDTNPTTASMVEAYERIEDLNNGNWCFVCIDVTIYRQGLEVAQWSSYGYESDNNARLKSATEETVAEALAQIK